MFLTPFLIKVIMNKASILVSEAITGKDFIPIIVNGKMYRINPPTIYKIAGASAYLAVLEDNKDLVGVISSLKDISVASRALSWFIEGNDSLEQELSSGTLEEILHGLMVAYSLISVENFTMLLDLAKNVANLTAKQKL